MASCRALHRRATAEHRAGIGSAWLRTGARTLAFLFLMLNGSVSAQSVFDLGPKKIDRVLVTIDRAMPGETLPASVMLRRLGGVLADEPGPFARELRACSKPGPAPKDLDRARSVAFIHLSAGDETRTVEILRTPSAVMIARAIAGTDRPPGRDPKPTLLDPDRLRTLSAGWSRYRGTFDQAEAPQGGVMASIDTPTLSGELRFDRDLLSERLLRGRPTRVDPMKRELDVHPIRVRPPKGYSPRSPVGLVVWVHADYDGTPPATLFAACDQLGLACVGIHGAGNNCPVADRYQLVFDALANAEAMLHIDPARVYITGISGGGKVSSVLWACFPDVFAGSVPIVGLACYENIHIGDGTYWPGLYAKPKPEIFERIKPHRSAAITGKLDFNYEPIQRTAEILARDGLNVRVIDIEGLDHEMPTPEDFARALAWVDEPAKAERDQHLAAGDTLWRAVDHGDPRDAPDADQRRALIHITEAAPWTPAAWRAAERLRPADPMPEK